MTHICISKLTIIGSDNGLLPGRRQAIIWTNAGILLIGSLGTNFNEIFIGIQTFSFKKMHLKMLSVKWRPFCLGLNAIRLQQHGWRSLKWKYYNFHGIYIGYTGSCHFDNFQCSLWWRFYQNDNTNFPLDGHDVTHTFQNHKCHCRTKQKRTNIFCIHSIQNAGINYSVIYVCVYEQSTISSY